MGPGRRVEAFRLGGSLMLTGAQSLVLITTVFCTVVFLVIGTPWILWVG